MKRKEIGQKEKEGTKREKRGGRKKKKRKNEGDGFRGVEERGY